MRKILLLAILLVSLISCTEQPIEVQKELQKPTLVTELVTPGHELYNPYEVAQPNVVLCGVLIGISTNYTSPGNVFVGRYYYILLDTPYNDGTTTWTKCIMVKNDAQNTPLIHQYWFNEPICDVVTYFYN